MLNVVKIFGLKMTHWRATGGLDFHVLLTLLFRGWAVIAGGITILLLPRWLTPIEQGYYFTFASVLGLQIFFELGLNQIVMQLVSHEVAHMKISVEGKLIGSRSRLAHLGSLASLIKRWYVIAAVLFAIIGGAAGAVFFSQRGTEPTSAWLGVWIVVVAATAMNLWLSPGLAVMEGCGKVGHVARLRLVQSMVGYACFWLALLFGFGLWAVSAVPVVAATCTYFWLNSDGNMLRWLSLQPRTDPQNKLSWRTDVLPLQWRIALSWASGYLIFSLFTPMVFSNQGAVEAGQLGMALTVFSAISTIGMSWVNAKAPNFTMHIARGERHELNSLFKSLFIRSTVVITLGCGIFILAAWFLRRMDAAIMARISSLEILAVIAVVTIANSAVFSMAVYMRAHREEPMLVQSLVVGLMISCAVYFGSKIGTFPMMFLYMLVSVFVSLPWTILLFRRYTKKVN